MSKINYVTVDRVFSKINRDLKGTDLNESDVIEWIGEALEFLQVPQVLVEDVKFLKVEDYHVDMPDGLHMITQIAKNTATDYPVDSRETNCQCQRGPEPEPCTCDSDACPSTDWNVDEQQLDNMPDSYALAFLNADTTQYLNSLALSKLDLDWTYTIWTSSEYYRRNYVPVRLATGTFFNSLVCKEKDKSLYLTCDYEYTIVGQTEKKLRFNFIEGDIAVSYLKNSVDKETGYPLIPDNISYITAITYYIKWKIAEMYDWAGREGWSTKAEKAEARWIKYVRQAKNFMKMPKTLDEHQNLLEQTHYLIPDHNKYYGFFGNLGKRQTRNFNTLNRVRTRNSY